MLCHVFWSQVEYKIVCFIIVLGPKESLYSLDLSNNNSFFVWTSIPFVKEAELNLELNLELGPNLELNLELYGI